MFWFNWIKFGAVSYLLSCKANRNETMSGGMCLTSRRISFSVHYIKYLLIQFELVITKRVLNYCNTFLPILFGHTKSWTSFIKKSMTKWLEYVIMHYFSLTDKFWLDNSLTQLVWDPIVFSGSFWTLGSCICARFILSYNWDFLTKRLAYGLNM